jgi:hypothetical protein
MQVTVDYTDLTVIARRLSDSRELTKAFNPYFKQGCTDYFSFAKSGYIPTRTNRLSNSIVQTFPKPLTCFTGTDGTVEYAQSVYFGARPHPIFPNKKKALKFSMGGDSIFAGKVNHPGNKPNPFLFKAWVAFSDTFRKYIGESFAKMLDKEIKK